MQFGVDCLFASSRPPRVGLASASRRPRVGLLPPREREGPISIGPRRRTGKRRMVATDQPPLGLRRAGRGRAGKHRAVSLPALREISGQSKVLRVCVEHICDHHATRSGRRHALSQLYQANEL